MKIVVVEDTDFAFEKIETSLREAGIADIERASNAKEARLLLRKIQEQTIWIIDGILPAMANRRPEIL